MRIPLITFAIAAVATVSAGERTGFVIRLEEIGEVRTIGDEVEIHTSTANTGAPPSADARMPISVRFAFVIPAEVGHDFYVSSAAWPPEGLILRVKFKDSQTAAAFAKFLDEKRPRI